MSGWDDGLCQDYCRPLSQWFASRVDARHQLRLNLNKENTMTKKIVHYRTAMGVSMLGETGGIQYAVLYPVDHPDTERVSNTREVITSPVVSHDPETGRIETMNTVYLPEVQHEAA